MPPAHSPLNEKLIIYLTDLKLHFISFPRPVASRLWVFTCLKLAKSSTKKLFLVKFHQKLTKPVGHVKRTVFRITSPSSSKGRKWKIFLYCPRNGNEERMRLAENWGQGGENSPGNWVSWADLPHQLPVPACSSFPEDLRHLSPPTHCSGEVPPVHPLPTLALVVAAAAGWPQQDPEVPSSPGLPPPSAAESSPWDLSLVSRLPRLTGVPCGLCCPKGSGCARCEAPVSTARTCPPAGSPARPPPWFGPCKAAGLGWGSSGREQP